MSFADAIPSEDLILARLVCSKLAKVMHGTLSVGMATLESSSPTSFLNNRDKRPLGFIEVLRSIGVNPGCTAEREMLREAADQLSELVSRFHSIFLELTRWQSMSPQNVRETADRLAEAYAQFCRSLGMFCSQLGIDSAYTDQGVAGREWILQCLTTLKAAS